MKSIEKDKQKDRLICSHTNSKILQKSVEAHSVFTPSGEHSTTRGQMISRDGRIEKDN